MKILLVSPLPPPIGGIASWTKNLLEYTAREVDDVQIVHVNSALKGIGITKYSSIGTRFFRGIQQTRRIFKELRKQVKQHKPQAVHLTSSASFALVKDLFLISWLSRRNIQVVVHWHFGRIPELARKSNWEWRLLSRVGKRASQMITIDKTSYQTLDRAGFQNILNIPNPIGLEEESRAKGSEGNTTSAQEKGRVLFVGHVIRNKGVYELLEACSSNKQVKELYFVGPYEEDVRSELMEIARTRDGDWIHFLGACSKSQVLDQMAKAHILVLPSYTEGFPIVLIEAMVMGCGIVATKVGAIPEMLDCGAEAPRGICISPGDSQELSEAISLMCTNAKKYEQLVHQAKEYALDSLSYKALFPLFRKAWVDSITGQKDKI